MSMDSIREFARRTRVDSSTSSRWIEVLAELDIAPPDQSEETDGES